ASERAQAGQKIVLDLEGSISCTPQSAVIGVVSNRSLTLRGGQGSIGGACDISVGAGSELQIAQVDLLGSIAVEEGGSVNLTEVLLDVEVCPFGWSSVPGSTQCMSTVSEIGLPLSVSRASELCAEGLGDDAARVPVLADVTSQADRDLAQSLLFDEAAWVQGSPCATILPDSSVSAAPCDSDQVRFAVCSVPKRVPISPPGAALLTQTQLLVTSPGTYRQLLSQALFPGDPLSGAQDAAENNTVVIAQRDVTFSALPLALAASPEEPWQVEIEVDHPCGDLVMQVGSDLNANLTEVTDSATPTGLVVQAELDSSPGELPRFIHVFANTASCACIHRVALLKGGVPFVDLDMQFAVEYKCDNSFPSIALSEDGCLLLDDGQRPDAVLPPQVTLDLDASECDRFSLKQHPLAGSPFEVRIGVQGDIDALTFEDADTSRKLVLTETSPEQFSLFLDETFARLVTSIRVIGNATIGTPKITSVQTRFEGAQVAGWDPADTHTCFKVCPVMHDAAGIDFGVVQQIEFRIDAVNKLDNNKTLCDEIESIVTYADLAAPTTDDTTDAETTCRAPVQQVALDDIQAFIDDNQTTWRYVPLVVNATETPQTADVDITIPPNLQVEIEQVDDLAVVAASLRVLPGGRLEISNFVLSGDISGFAGASNSGFLLMEGCTVVDNFGIIASPTELPPTFDVVTKVVACDLVHAAVLPLLTSVIELDSVTVRSQSTLSTISSPPGSVALSRVEVEQGALALTSPLVVDFLDLEPEISIADPLTDPACVTSSQPPSPLFDVRSFQECQSTCQADALCIGFFFDALGPSSEQDTAQDPVCGLCLPPGLGGCSFDCSLPSSTLLRLQPVVAFADLGDQVCGVGEGLAYDSNNLTLRECQGWCSSKPDCAMISYDSTDAFSCTLFEVSAVVPCTSINNNRIFVDTKVVDDFEVLPAGVCIDRSSSTAAATISTGVSRGSCAAACVAMGTDCTAFEIVDLGFPTSCDLFSSPVLTTTCSNQQGTSTLVDLSDASFPSLDQGTIAELDCNPPTSFALAEHVVSSIGRCKAQCDVDPACDTFTFSSELGLSNCWTFQSSALDVLFDETTCVQDPTAATRTFLGVNRADFVESAASGSLSCGSQRFPALSLTLEQCKEMCSALVPGCTRIAYDDGAATCRLTCDPADGQPVAATHAFQAAPPGVDSGIEYFGDVAVCSEDMDLIDIARVASTRFVDLCRVLCDIDSDCVGFTTDASCNLVRNVALRPSTSSCASVVNARIIFQGKPIFDFVAAPETARFAGGLSVVPEGANSVRVCQQTCVEDLSCFAASLRASDQACLHFGSRKFSPDPATAPGARPFVQYTRSFFEEAFGGAIIKGASILRTLSDVPRAACLRACDLTAACLAVRHDAESLSCELRAGDNVVTASEAGDADAFFGRVQVNPFTEVSTEFKTVCPDPAAQLSSMPPGAVFDVEACQALCEAELSCGSVVFDKATRTCKLYDRDSFVVTDTPSCRTPDEVMFVSYVQFLERDSRKMSEVSGTPGLCLDNVQDFILGGVVFFTGTQAACEARCLDDPECGAYLYNAAPFILDDCKLLTANLSLSACDVSSNTEVLEIKYVGTSFSQINSTSCLADTSSTLVNRFTEATSVPECAALCEAHVTCVAFRMENGCELFDSAETLACSFGLEEDAYAKFSDKPFSRVGRQFCAASSRIATLSGTLETCKAVCAQTDGCGAVQHNEAGECILRETGAFFPCEDSNHVLFVSHEQLLLLDVPETTSMLLLDGVCYRNREFEDSSCLSTGTCGWGVGCSSDSDCADDLECVAANGSFQVGTVPLGFLQFPPAVCMGPRNSDKDDCVATCLADPDCKGVQFFSGTGDDVCGRLTQQVFDRLETRAKFLSCGDTGFQVFLKVSSAPSAYRSLEGACLKRSLEDRVGVFRGRSLVDCMAICESYATCKHFSLSDFGECKLFGLQMGDVEEADCDTSVAGVTTYINTQALVDAVEYLGEPEHIMTEAPGLTYDECATACASLDKCEAFIHDWSKRQVTGSLDVTVEPQRVATKTVTGTLTRVWEVLEDSNQVHLTAKLDTNYTVQQRLYFESAGGDQVRVLFFAEDDRFFGDHLCLALSGTDITADLCSELDVNQVFVRGTSADGFLTLSPVSRPGDCVSWASETSLTLSSGDCTSDTSLFERASSGVRLSVFSDKFKCVSSKEVETQVSLEQCRTDADDVLFRDAEQWTFLFESGRWVAQRILYQQSPYEEILQEQTCLYAGSDGVVARGSCVEANSTFSLGIGGSIKGAFSGGEGQCVTAQGEQLRMEQCAEDGADDQTWVRFAVCKLTTRETSAVMALENVFSKECWRDSFNPYNSVCDEPSSSRMISCGRDIKYTSVDRVRYVYSATNPALKFTLEELGTSGRPNGRCLGRDSTLGSVGSESCGDAAQYPFVNWLFNARNLTFTSLDGRVLAYSPCSGRVVAYSDSEVVARGLKTAWRKSEPTGGAVELSVPATPINFEVTDPEVLFQVWLWSDFGIRSRKLLAKVESVSNTVSRLSAFVKRCKQAIERAIGALNRVEGVLAPPVSTLNRISSFLLVVDPILRIFERVPYVGPVVRGVRLRSILSSARKAFNKAKRTGGRLGTVALSGTAVVTGLLTGLLDASDSLDELPSRLRSIASLITRLTRCAFEQANQAVQSGLDALMDKIGDGIDTLQVLMGQLGAILKPVSRAIDSVTSRVLKPINALRAALRPTERIVDALDFLVKLFAFRIPIKYPVGVKWKRGCVFGGCLQIKWRTTGFGLEQIGEFLAWLERTIRKIPGVGWVLDVIDRLVSAVLGKLFPRIRIPMPNFGALEGFGVLDNVGSKVSELVDALNDKVDDLMSAALGWVEDLDGLIDLSPIEDLIAKFPVFDGFPECNDINCLLNLFELPSVSAGVMDDIILLANRTARLQQVVENPDFGDRVGNLMQYTGDCIRYKELPIIGLDQVAVALGLNESEVCRELLDNGARSLEYCEEFEVDPRAEAEADALGSWLSTELSDLAEEFAQPEALSRRQLLDGPEFNDLSGQNMTVMFTVAVPIDDLLPQCVQFGRSVKWLNRHVKATSAQIRFQLFTSWSRILREAMEPTISLLDAEESLFSRCSLQDLTPCKAFVEAYRTAEFDRADFSVDFDPGTLQGQRKWEELSGPEQIKVLQLLDKYKSGKTLRQLQSKAVMAREAVDEVVDDPIRPCRLRYSDFKNALFQFRVSSQGGSELNGESRVEMPFTGFQINLGNFITYRRDMHIYPAVSAETPREGLRLLFERAGNRAGMFKGSFLACSKDVWFDKTKTVSQKWAAWKSQCDKRPDFFVGGSLHLGIAINLLQCSPRLECRVFGRFGKGSADDQLA
ncbi:Uncharacterized protein (Fragment), partial [Durusdinium trenchii]